MVDQASDSREILRVFATTTTLHGVPRVMMAGSGWIKIFWMIVTVAAFVAFVIQTSRLFVNYAGNPVKVEIKVSSTVKLLL